MINYMKNDFFSPSFELLRKYRCPDWFRDAKFGIWSHWGPQSVPMFGDWYARSMYIQGSPSYLYHLRHYGHPSKVGYKDICRMWKAEKFDPDGLMDLYVKAGARYFVAQAVHHDHFFNYPSGMSRFNSMEMGPKMDICGMWRDAAANRGLPFGLSEHLGASFSWWNTNKGADSYGPYAGIPYDGNDENYRDLYYENQEHYLPNGERSLWYTDNREFQEYWLKAMKEMIGRYQPDLLYSDGGLPFGHREDTCSPEEKIRTGIYQKGLEAVAYLYNTSIEKFGENRAVYTQKDKSPQICGVGILDVEKSQLDEISRAPWQTDSCIGNWFYDAVQKFKKPGHIIEILVDVISKNGTLLLNILQRPDGSIDDETEWILKELASWFSVCGEGVYETRPWRICSEGDTRVLIQGFTENETEWNASDYRFTQKRNTVFAFMMRRPENGVAVVKSFRPDEVIKNVRLLGYGSVKFSQNFGVLNVCLPESMPTEYINCLAVEFS